MIFDFRFSIFDCRPRAAAFCILHSAFCILLGVLPVAAHPEYQTFAQKQSGRTVNCGMCHVNPDGPVGAGPGQIGRLKPVEMDRLNQARAAFAPGREVDSPILNAFGNQIIRTLGKTRVIELRRDPKALAGALGTGSDVDHDGIADSREYLDGTHPADPSHGAPWLLFRANLVRHGGEIAFVLVAVGALMAGLRGLRKGCALT